MNDKDDINQGFPRLKILNESQIKRIHIASLRILEETGIVFHENEAISLLHDAGAKIIGKNAMRLLKKVW